MEKVAFVFPGQGSQYIGMGASLIGVYPHIAGRIFAQADEILGYLISKVCFQGPNEDLNKTIHAQPAMFVANYICLKILEEEKDIIPYFVAGHSLGEYSALVAAKVITFETGLKIVQERAWLMQQATKYPGGMVAVIGKEGIDQKVKDFLLFDFDFEVRIANFNSPNQVVISGSEKELQKAIEELKKKKIAKRIVRLKIDGAFHHPIFMRKANIKLKKVLCRTHFSKAKIPIVTNSNADILVNPQKIKEALLVQMISPVLWEKSIKSMIREGVNTFVEVGPKEVLSRLTKEINPDLKTQATEKPEKMEKTIKYLREIRG